MSYLVNILVLVNLYIILAVSFNILLGYAGLFSIAHAVFYGLGAYISALAVMKLGLPIPVAILLATVVTGAIGLPLAVPALRVSGDYLAIAMLSLQVVIVQVLLNLDITGGAAGLIGIPRISFLGGPISTPAYAVITGIVAICLVFFTRWLVRSPFGRVLKGIREDALATESLGKNVNAFKLVAFAIGCGMAAVAGGLYAHYFQLITPYDYQLQESIFILSMVVVGGIGTVWGPAVGALLLMALPESLRFLDLPSGIAAPLKQIIYSGIVIAFLYLRPQGILGRRGPEAALEPVQDNGGPQNPLRRVAVDEEGNVPDRCPNLSARDKAT